MDLGDVTGSVIQDAGFEDQEFEEFVDVLLRDEVDRRHPGAKVHGPTKKGKADGGRDSQVTIVKEPRVARDDAGPALTWDEPRVTWYSCKTTTRHRGWVGSVKKDLGWPDYERHRKGEPPRNKGKRPSLELLRAMSQGARYVLVINEQAGSEDAFLDKLEKVFEYWLANPPGLGTPLPLPKGLRARLELIDANHLAHFVRYHKPALPGQFRDRLGTVEPDGLQDWPSWSATQSAGREPIGFVEDLARTELLAAVADVGSTRRIIRIHGAPGVGKTRLVHQAMGTLGPSATTRVRYCNDIRRGQQIVESAWLSKAGTVYLVLDEARTTDIKGVTSRFLAAADPSARLFLVGTSDGESRDHEHPEIRSFPLKQLEDSAAQRLIEQELGSSVDESLVQAVLHLSEGYPLFAVLLAQALAIDADSIEHPRDPASEWLAALRVLAGPRAHYADEQSWRAEAEVRAKCLLVVLLTDGLECSWDELWERYRKPLAAVFGRHESSSIEAAESDCTERGLLRHSGARTRRYVSPRNLARMIINRFFTPPGDLGPKIRRHLPQRHASLHSLAQTLRVRSEVRGRLARGEWEGLVETTARIGVEAGDILHGDGLYQAARRVPELAVQGIDAALGQIEDTELSTGRSFRELLRPSLEHLVHRKLSAPAFERVETALFRLGSFDREPWSNNSVGIWRSLFLTVLDDTHRPWLERLALLRRRLVAPEPAGRRLAISALEVAVDPDERGVGHSEDDRVDGSWPGRDCSEEEISARKGQLWALLLDRCEDADMEVAEEARTAVARRLGKSIGRGLDEDLLGRLSSAVRSWTAMQRQRVSEALLEMRCYDSEELERLPVLRESTRALGAALRPESFRERLFEHVGRWSPGERSITDEDERPRYEARVDESLIEEALADPSRLDAEMDWLVSDAAKRKGAFAERLGARDRYQRFLHPLEDATRRSGDHFALVRYLQGWAQRDLSGVDRWLDVQVSEPSMQAVVAAVVPRLPPSVARLRQLRVVLTKHEPNPVDLVALGTESWIGLVPGENLLDFAEEVVAAHPGLAVVAVNIAVAMLERTVAPSHRERLVDVLALGTRQWASRRIAIFGQRRWHQAILVLLDEERYSDIVDALGAAVDSSLNGANVALAHKVLHSVVQRSDSAAVWDHIARPMLERMPGEPVARGLGAAGLLERVGAPTLVEWAGDDDSRGVVLANTVGLHSDELSPLARELLLHFGSSGRVADTLHARAHSSIGRARSGKLDDFYREQLRHARRWGQDPKPQIRQWAHRVVESLEASIAYGEARDQFERRYERGA